MPSADQIRIVVGIIGNVTALLLFLSPAPTFSRIIKNKSIEKFSAIPYVATLLNCMLWMLYGMPIVKPNSTLLLTLNGAGIVIELCYIFIYVIYSDGSRRVRTLLLLLINFIFVASIAAIVLSVCHTHERRSLVIGIFCILFCIMMYGAPLAVMRTVVKTKSVEYMPLFLSVASFVNGLCWTVYSLLKFDVNILIPNGVGMMFSITQLVLHAMYYKSTKRQLEERKMQGEVVLSNVAVSSN